MGKRPTTLALSRQVAPNLAGTTKEGVAKGAYVVQGEAAGKPVDCVLMGTGTELELACIAGEKLAKEGKKVRVVSMPCWELFEEQSAEYQESVFPKECRARVSIEAGHTMGWQKYTTDDGIAIGVDTFGASAPAGKLYEAYGITVENMLAKARSLL